VPSLFVLFLHVFVLYSGLDWKRLTGESLLELLDFVHEAVDLDVEIAPHLLALLLHRMHLLLQLRGVYLRGRLVGVVLLKVSDVGFEI